jgi:hypothetical protein
MDAKEQTRLLGALLVSSKHSKKPRPFFRIHEDSRDHCSVQFDVCNANIFATSDLSMQLKDTKAVAVCRTHK